MLSDISLIAQTAYAELLDRARSAAFDEAFPDDGAFTPKVLRGRCYWYFQASSRSGRGQTYVGPETPELLLRIAQHKAARTWEKDRRGLVSMLVRGGNLPAPPRAIGDLVAALAQAGVFRLRGVLIGTVAYQTYAAMLGTRLPAAVVQTNDVDVAQYANVSKAVADTTGPMAAVLTQADPSFRPEPYLLPGRTVSYVAASGLRVDFLAPNEGRETDEPVWLPALGTDAQQLRFLDFLIREPEQAVLLHGTGVLVTVPAPERFALHKLIVSRRRRSGDPKQEKDRAQARALLEALIVRRPHALRAAWSEAMKRGKRWRVSIGEAMAYLPPATRDRVLHVAGAARDVVPGLDYRPVPGRAVYDTVNETVRFFAQATAGVSAAENENVACSISRAALEAMPDGAAPGTFDPLKTFATNRERIDRMAKAKYLHHAVGNAGEVNLNRNDMTMLS